jgi:hypothetical protein
MGDKPDKSASPATKSGVLPRVDQAEIKALYEGKHPPMPPEMEDLGSVTGRLSIISEGEDKAKQKDDPATES